jgi:hypothetical protein
MFFCSPGRFPSQSKTEWNRGFCQQAFVPAIVRGWGRAFLILSLLLGPGIAFAGETVPGRGQLLQVPMQFEVNQGQAAAPVEFLSRGNGYTLFLTPAEAVLSLRAKKPAVKASGASSSRGKAEVFEARLGMSLVGADRQPRSEGIDPLPGVANYFLGDDPSGWRTGIPTFGKVKYHEVYPGVDLIYYGNQRQLEYDFIISPFGDPKNIAFRLEGAERVEIEKNGDLLIHVSGGVVRWHKPVSYQEGPAGRTDVPTRFRLKRGEEVSFEVGEYDRSRPLVIDPVVVYATYLGGAAGDFAFGIAV